MPIRFSRGIWICLALLLCQVALAETAPEHNSAFSFRFENDFFGSTDRFYTNGFSLTWAHAGRPRGAAGLLWNALRAPDWLPGRLSHTYEIGQIITTPEDTALTMPDPEDRPYAGILFLASAIQFDRESSMDIVKLITGVLGPAALGEQTQNGVHRLLGVAEAEGWDAQLGNEPILNVVYEHRQRVRLARRPHLWGAELIGTGGAMLGNVLTQAQAGLQFRFGYRLPNDFGHTLIRGAGNIPPVCHCGGGSGGEQDRFGVQFFTGMTGNLVARNVTLDGNTFRDSPSVDRTPFFAGVEAGVSVVYRRMLIGYALVIWGSEFEAQVRNSKFGALFFSVGF